MYLSAVREAMDALDLLHNTLKKIRFVVGWLGSIHGVYCHDFRRLPVASCCSARVSCSSVDALHTLRDVNFRRLPLSPAVSQCLQPV